MWPGLAGRVRADPVYYCSDLPARGCTAHGDLLLAQRPAPPLRAPPPPAGLEGPSAGDWATTPRGFALSFWGSALVPRRLTGRPSGLRGVWVSALCPSSAEGNWDQDAGGPLDSSGTTLSRDAVLRAETVQLLREAEHKRSPQLAVRRPRKRAVGFAVPGRATGTRHPQGRWVHVQGHGTVGDTGSAAGTLGHQDQPTGEAGACQGVWDDWSCGLSMGLTATVPQDSGGWQTVRKEEASASPRIQELWAPTDSEFVHLVLNQDLILKVRPNSV